MMCRVSRLPIAPACSFLAQGAEVGIEAPVEAEKEPRLAERRSRRSRALRAEVDGLLAEDCLARGGSLQAVRKMLVGRAGDDHSRDGRIGQGTLQCSRRRAVPRRQRRGDVTERVDDVLQRQGRMRRGIGRMNLSYPGPPPISATAVRVDSPNGLLTSAPVRGGRRLRGPRAVVCDCCEMHIRSRESARDTSTPTTSGSRGSPPPAPAGRFRPPWRSG